MEKSDLSKYHVDYYLGCRMHTTKVGVVDEARWVYHGCDESQIKDNVLYKVWLTRSTPADPADQSSHTNVYYFEEVTAEIVEMKKEVEEYWKSDEPLNPQTSKIDTALDDVSLRRGYWYILRHPNGYLSDLDKIADNLADYLEQSNVIATGINSHAQECYKLIIPDGERIAKVDYTSLTLKLFREKNKRKKKTSE